MRRAVAKLAAIEVGGPAAARYEALVGLAERQYALVRVALNAIERKGADPGRVLRVLAPQLRAGERLLGRAFTRTGVAACAGGSLGVVVGASGR